jgi:predicted nucleotidyltransferase
MASHPFESVKSAVLKCVSRRREIQAAYIFGSVASGRVRPDSDIDIAVLVGERFQSADRLKYRLDLMTDLGSSLKRRDVDVVVLNEASPLLAHRVLSKGILIFERSGSARVRFQVETASRYLDLVPMYETQIRYLKKGLGKDLG